MFGQPVLAPWQLHALQHDPRLRRKRLAKQAALVDAEDYVDAVYMVLAAAAHAQANTARDALVWNPPHGSGRRPAQAWATPHTLSSARLVGSEDHVDVVYMVLAAAARTHASVALCSATHACAGKTFSKAGSWQPSATLAWNPFKGSTSNGTLNPKSLYLGWLGRANLATQGERLGGFYPRASNHICTP